MGMGQAFEKEFIAQCLRDAEACLQGLEQSGKRADWAAAHDHAHALKGVAGNLGLVKLADASGEVLLMAEWQLSRDWRRYLSMLREYMAQGRAALDARSRVRSVLDNESS
jgi:two-component system sensor histidine kinase RpfC